MFEKLKNIYKKIINNIKNKNKVPQLDTINCEKIIETKKIEIYQYNENNAKEILEEIHNQNLEYDITLEDIKKNYSKYKSIQEQGKIELLQLKNDTIPIDDFIEIINTVTKDDIEYLQNIFSIGKRMIVQAIYDMGINKFIALKSEGKLYQFMNLQNYNKLMLKVTEQEMDLMMKFRRIDCRNSVINNFYLYWNLIKYHSQEEIDMLLLINNDEFQYINSRSSLSAEKLGYKWYDNMLVIPDVYKMSAVASKRINKELTLDIRQKLNIPLNIILTAVLELGIFPNEEEIEKNDLEKILLNYYKFNLNINQDKNIEQVKKLLLSLPKDLSSNYETIIKECLVGRLRRFNLENFEQLENYEKICDEKILQEFQENDNLSDLKKLILETKIKNLEGIKRDIYFYKKYNRQKAEGNEVINLFDKLLKSQDKQELLTAYKKINDINEDFDLDSVFDDIREELSQISKQDVILEMQKMQEKIKNAETRYINGQDAIDITGTDFNLLISVIGSTGSAYLANYYNNMLDKLAKFKDSKKLFPILKRKTDMQIKLGIKRRVNKRYKLDPLKNKQRCVSSIDQDFIGHIKSESYINSKKQTEEKLILAYFPENKEDVSYMGNQDLMSIYDKKRSDVTRKRIPHKDNLQGVCNLKLRDLNATTIGDDNEVIINSYPGAVMCFDKISNISSKTAQKLNIPILYINTKKQFDIMKNRVDDYYKEIQEQISQNNYISNETFNNIFNIFEQDNNIIHRAFKIANSFTFLDDDEYPKEQVIEVFNNMTSLVNESLKRCNPEQQKVIQEIMFKEADYNNLRYGNYDIFINFEELKDLVSMKNKEEEEEVKI